MRVKIIKSDHKIVFGTFVGLTSSDDGVGAIVRLDGNGLFCTIYHPSLVVPIDTEEKP